MSDLLEGGTLPPKQPEATATPPANTEDKGTAPKPGSTQENKPEAKFSDSDMAKMRTKYEDKIKALETASATTQAFMKALGVNTEEDVKKLVEIRKSQMTQEQITNEELKNLREYQTTTKSELDNLKAENSLLKAINMEFADGKLDTNIVANYAKTRLGEVGGDFSKAVKLVLKDFQKPTTPPQQTTGTPPKAAETNVGVNNPAPNPSMDTGIDPTTGEINFDKRIDYVIKNGLVEQELKKLMENNYTYNPSKLFGASVPKPNHHL